MSETNYAFGYSSRQGSCSIDASIRFTDADTASGYVEVAESDRNEAGAGRFANFCRMDLKRTTGGIALTVRGAASFACSDPESMPWDEKIVCLDPVLAALDRQMAAAFGRARTSATAAAASALAASQRAWLKERRETCDADRRYSCVKALYERRLIELARPPK